MPWTTPTLAEVRALNRDFVRSHLRSGSLIPNSALRVLADGNAGLAHLTLQYIDWLSRQLLPDTAEGDWLRERHAAIWLGGWKEATFASGSALEAVLSRGADAVLDEMARAGLRGMGGAGFKTKSFQQLRQSGVHFLTVRQNNAWNLLSVVLACNLDWGPLFLNTTN
jgi:uncharacterized phage protein gp47/JayE